MLNLLRNIARNLTAKPATRLYPFEKRTPPAGTRGHVENAIEKCIFCGMCQKRCPSSALAVTRDPKSWTLDPYACVVCGYCVDVCPVKCLSLSPDHLPPT